jgi:Spy/CpxP family protein refolding chaperone
MIVINLDKAKAIGHDIRRAERAKEFSPLDVQATIPSQAEQAEAARQVVREKYAEIQSQIEAAETPEEIKIALNMGGV